MENILFVLLHISTIFVFLMFVYLLRQKQKGQIQIIFLVNILLLFIWSIGYIFEVYYTNTHGAPIMAYVYVWNIGLCFIPSTILLTGIVYTKTKIRFSIKYILLFIPAVVSYIILVTNQYHKLFFIHFSMENDQIKYGAYFPIHSFFSYGYLIIGLFIIIRFSIKNSGFFSRQSILIVIGTLIPLVANIVIITKVVEVPLYSTAIAFSLAIICYAIAIFRYQFLSIAPIALRTVVDRISDAFIVINEDYHIIDYNLTMDIIFNGLVTINRKINIGEVFENTCLMEDEDDLIKLINVAKTSSAPVIFSKHIQQDKFDKHFSIEITPIISNKNYLGTILLFRDITANIKNQAAMEEKQRILMEQERLASLGQLIGGIAHNLKTPIMSISGAAEGLKDLVAEYELSTDDQTVTAEDHHEIAAEMRTWLNKIQPHCGYMADIIDTVKGQAMTFSNSTAISFSINELVKRIELLLKYELTRSGCTLVTDVKVDSSTELFGDINSLIQVFDNIIINAIQAYEGKNGRIELTIEETDESILFSVKDYAKGIPYRVRDKLLKEMVTTKGTAGTGLGLYMSCSTIKARFEGKMWFKTTEGKGTTFYVQIPRQK